MDELDLFRSFRRGVASPSADARERAARRLAEVIEGARAPGTRQRHNTRRTVALALAILVVGVGAAAAFGTVRDLLSSDTDGQAGKPTWSPDGLSIAYVVWIGPDAPNELFVMNADGSAQRTVARDRWLIRSPVWSPDSRRIAFLTNPCNAVAVARGCARRTTISVINADGSGRRKLVRGAGPARVTVSPGHPTGDGQPSSATATA